MAERNFPSTHWSSLLNLHDPTSPQYAQHLEHLIQDYWKPVYHYVRTLRQVSAEDAEDLTQQFFTMLLSRHDLQRLSPDRGSFRGFLKTSIRHFLLSVDRAAIARKPRDDGKLFRFEEAEQVWQDARRQAPELSPEEAFDREWANGVLREAVVRLEETLAVEGKELYFKLFRDYCLEPSGLSGAKLLAENQSYSDLARNYGISVDDVRNHLRYARNRIRDILKDLVKDYLGPGPASVEDELRFLLSR